MLKPVWIGDDRFIRGEALEFDLDAVFLDAVVEKREDFIDNRGH